MSMIFKLQEQVTTRCPGCHQDNVGSDLEEVKWYRVFANRIAPLLVPTGSDTSLGRLVKRFDQ